ncbi:hypothetical protein GPALN_011039 [Globodera pallida]|nr:hypothetical protein GPALN_011039 [Globodera pallida]
MARKRKRAGKTNPENDHLANNNRIASKTSGIYSEANGSAIGTGSGALPKNKSSEDPSGRVVRQRIVFWRSPFRTLWYCGLEVVQISWDYGRSMLSLRRLLPILFLIGCLLFLVIVPGRHNPHVKRVEKKLLWCIYWLGLGVLSSIGLGTGLHTFLLYLGPHIARVTLAAFECNSLDFPEPPYPDDVTCSTDANGHASLITLWTIISKVRLESLMWGAGTALGELPPFFMARAARLSGQEPDDEEYKEFIAFVEGDLNKKLTWVERTKLWIERTVTRVGFPGILLFASIPNPFFDLAGITCGHFLIPFWTFFGATLIGKALVKMHVQMLFVVLAFSEHHVEHLVSLLNKIPRVGSVLQAPIKEFLFAQKLRLHRQPGDPIPEQASSFLQQVMSYFVSAMIIWFVLSLINSLAQQYQKRMWKAICMPFPLLARKVKRFASQHILQLKHLLGARGFSTFKRLYRLKGELGHGGFGIVYRAVRISDQLPVAVKFIERRNVRDWGKLDDHRVPMEIALLARCSHVPGVIALLDWFSLPEGFLIVMERPIRCMDLFDFIHYQKTLDENLARFLFRQIVEAVIELAERRVLHRDLKDENILINLTTGQIKLIDFGAATALTRNRCHDFQGTRLYCPPEWFLHSLYLGREATVWSLGVLLFNMLNGRLPFLNEKDVCTAHLLGPLPFFTALSKAARDLLAQCLSFEAFSRPSLHQILAHPWLNKKSAPADWGQLSACCSHLVVGRVEETADGERSATAVGHHGDGRRRRRVESGLALSCDELSAKMPHNGEGQEREKVTPPPHTIVLTFAANVAQFGACRIAQRTAHFLGRRRENVDKLEAEGRSSTQTQDKLHNAKPLRRQQDDSLDSGNASALHSPRPLFSQTKVPPPITHVQCTHKETDLMN